MSELEYSTGMPLMKEKTIQVLQNLIDKTKNSEFYDKFREEADDELRKEFEKLGNYKGLAHQVKLHYSEKKKGYCLVKNGQTSMHHFLDSVENLNHIFYYFSIGYRSRQPEIEQTRISARDQANMYMKEIEELKEKLSDPEELFFDDYIKYKNMWGVTHRKVFDYEEALNSIKSQIHKHRTWTGQGWKQNPLAVFVAEKILKIIDGVLDEEN